ncbi:MAG: hypothetical protein HKN43_13195 [Rhodothermales bacterium]|nr:hypothetical protein [Rhodothermales bacterium]
MTIAIQNNLQKLLVAVLFLSFAGCDMFRSDDPQAGTISLEIVNMIDGQELVLDQELYTSSAGHDYSVSLIEYILTNVKLHRADGTVVSLDTAQYCNQEDHDSRHLDSEEIPAGQYDSISFTFGVDGAENVFGSLERTTDFDNMLWPMMAPMGDGTTERYHYMRFEGHYGVDKTFRIHNGPSGGSDYSFDVSLPISMDVDNQDWAIELQMNLEEWLTNPVDWDFDAYGMIMGNQAAQEIVQTNGSSVFSIGSVDEL